MNSARSPIALLLPLAAVFVPGGCALCERPGFIDEKTEKHRLELGELMPLFHPFERPPPRFHSARSGGSPE